MTRLRTWLLPALLAAGQLLIWPGLIAVFGEDIDPARVVLAAIAVLGAATALLWRRTRPELALAAAVAALALAQWAEPGDRLMLISVADMIALYSVAVHRPRRTALVAGAAVTAWQLGLTLLIDRPRGWELVLSLIAVVVITAVTVVGGRVRRRWNRQRAEAARRLAEAQTRQREAAAAERHRLARELHDVTAHHLTSIVVSTNAAQLLAERRPEPTREALDFALRTGRETLAALHKLVAVMQMPDERGALAAVQLADLADGFGRLGQPVVLDVPEALPGSPAAEALYGITREALTNTLRYAPGAEVRIRVTRDAAGLTLEVVNEPQAGPAAAGGLGGGRGITGMRERATALGGTLDAGPRPEGGWRVSAVLPASATAAARRPLWRRLGPEHVLGLALIGLWVSIPLVSILAALDEMPTATAAEPVLLVVAALLHTAPLWWRRRRPWAVYVAVTVTGWFPPVLAAVGALPVGAALSLFVGYVSDAVAVFAVARYGRRPKRTWAAIPITVLSITLAVTATTPFLGPGDLGGEEVNRVVLLIVAVVFTVIPLTPAVAGAWGIGYAVRARRDRIAATEHWAVADATARAVMSAGAERARIATGLRAAVLDDAGRVITAAEAGDLDGVLAGARSALTAMRGLLSGLRDAPTGQVEPQPTLADLGRLGVTVTGDLPDVPPSVAASAYRVVEMLAGATSARITSDGRTLSLAVVGVPPDPDGARTAGLRARLSAVGGTIVVGDRSVEIRWPLAEEVASSPSA